MEYSSKISDDGQRFTEFDDNGNHLTEPNCNIEEVISMTEMEHLYFSSDALEYFPDDWTPSSSFTFYSLSEERSISMPELSLVLIDVLCEEIRSLVPSPLKRKFDIYPSDVKDSSTTEWKNHMPIAYAVNRDEYYEYINDYVLRSTKCAFNHNVERADDTEFAKTVFVDKQENLSARYLQMELERALNVDHETASYRDAIFKDVVLESRKKKVPIKNVPRRKARTVGCTRSVKVTTKFGKVPLSVIPRNHKNGAIRNENGKTLRSKKE